MHESLCEILPSYFLTQKTTQVFYWYTWTLFCFVWIRMCFFLKLSSVLDLYFAQIIGSSRHIVLGINNWCKYYIVFKVNTLPLYWKNSQIKCSGRSTRSLLRFIWKYKINRYWSYGFYLHMGRGSLNVHFCMLTGGEGSKFRKFVRTHHMDDP